MADRGLGDILRPIVYVGLAVLAHGLLFLVPWKKFESADPGTTRGVRVKVVHAAPELEQAPVAPPAPPVPSSPPSAPPPTVAPEKSYSMLGGGRPGEARETTGAQAPTAPGYGGKGQSGNVPVEGRQQPQSEYGAYLARLRSEGVQGWARDAATQSRQGWKGTGGKGSAGLGGGSGAGQGAGTSGGGRGSDVGSGGTGRGYLDPRVKMVVTSYNPTKGTFVGQLENRLSQVPYPDLKIRKNQFTSGWWNVYFQVRTDSGGKVASLKKLLPETDGPLEKIFVDQVRREIGKWTFDPIEAEINVDVRFYVE